MTAVISIIISYLIGAISFSYLLAKKLKKVDIEADTAAETPGPQTR